MESSHHMWLWAPFPSGKWLLCPWLWVGKWTLSFWISLGEWKGNNRAMKEAVYKKNKKDLNDRWVGSTSLRYEAQVSGTRMWGLQTMSNAVVIVASHLQCVKQFWYPCVDKCCIWRCSLELRKLKAGEYWKAIVSSVIPILVETAEVLW